MKYYLFKRSIALIATLLLVSIAIFVVMAVIPGDPAQIILGINATPETLNNLREQLGLNRPLIVQYLDWIGSMMQGDLGRSLTYDVPISRLFADRLLVTLPLSLMAILFALTISIPLGIYAATHQNRVGDYGAMIFSQIGLAVPAFWAGILLILLFSVKLGWMSAGGFVWWGEDPWGAVRSLLMPAFALGLIRAAVLTRLTRSSMIEVLREDYVRTARAKGIPPRLVVYKHALFNAVIPVLTIVGMQMGQLLTGAIIIENVFYLPGLGRLLFQAIGQRDLPVVREGVLLIACLIILINFVVDILYAWFDPRIRLE
jgi:peptide/nickel transport system permease protein